MTQPEPVKTIIIVPCYNEQSRFAKDKFLSFAKRTSGPRFLFVDDGSTDRTAELLAALKQAEPNRFDFLKLNRNYGKAEAIRQAFVSVFENPRYEFIGFWDADLSTPLDLIGSFVEIFERHPKVEMVFGARVKLMGRNIQRRAFRHYSGRVFATLASMVLDLKIYDTQCGAKMFRVTDTLKRIFGQPFKSKWIFDVEILARFLKERKCSRTEAEDLIHELPLNKWQDVSGSKLKAKDYCAAFSELIQIYFNYR